MLSFPTCYLFLSTFIVEDKLDKVSLDKLDKLILAKFLSK